MYLALVIDKAREAGDPYEDARDLPAHLRAAEPRRDRGVLPMLVSRRGLPGAVTRMLSDRLCHLTRFASYDVLLLRFLTLFAVL